MTTEAAKKIRAKRARRPIYLLVTRLIDGATGCDVGALIPANEIDARLLRERGFHMGKEIRAELKQSRNPKFHRLAHAVGNLLVDNVEEFRDLSGHDALKRVQTLSGVCCETQLVDMGTIKFGEIEVPVGLVPVKVPRSIAFDEMDSDEFGIFFRGVVGFIDENYQSVLTADVWGEYLLMTENSRP